MAQPTCVRCGYRRWLPIAYGYPGPGMFEAADAGKLVLGGCIVDDGNPKRQCRICGLPEGAEPDWTGANGPTFGEFAEFHRAITAPDVPSYAADEPTLLEFALTFDGYAAFDKNLTTVARDVHQKFHKGKTLPSNPAVQRGALFAAQRAAKHSDAPFHTDYVAALLDALRTTLEAKETE